MGDFVMRAIGMLVILPTIPVFAVLMVVDFLLIIPVLIVTGDIEMYTTEWFMCNITDNIFEYFKY